MAFQAQALNNDNDVEMYGVPPIVTNTPTYRGLKDLAYAPGNVKPKTPEPGLSTKEVTILIPPGKSNRDNNTNKGAGILTLALIVY